jgi:hypothetical protein
MGSTMHDLIVPKGCSAWTSCFNDYPLNTGIASVPGGCSPWLALEYNAACITQTLAFINPTMNLSDAIDELKRHARVEDKWTAAFLTATAARQQWPIVDMLGYEDMHVNEGFYLPDSADWPIEVDVITKPKQSGGVRIERFPDIFTGTLLQAVSNLLMEATLPEFSIDIPRAPVRREGAQSYEAWTKAITSALQQQLSMGRAVVIIDFADFFANIHPHQIHRAITAAGLPADLAKAILVIFDWINAAPARAGARGMGLPTIPDDIAWVLADLVLRPFDERAMKQPLVSSYARWVDDCFIGCDAKHAEDVLHAFANLASDCGFRLNSAKSRIIASFDDLDAMLLQREHSLLDDLFAVRPVGHEVDFSKHLPQLKERVTAGPTEHTRLIKRLYTLAAVTNSPALLPAVENDLGQFPAAERQILAYLNKLGWPVQFDELLVRALGGDGYDSRQLFTLWLLLECEPQTIPAVARRACEQILDGSISAHPFALPLAFAVLEGAADNIDQRYNARFAESVALFSSAMARRVGLELLWLAGCKNVKWSAFVDDPSLLVRRFVEFLSSPQMYGALGHLAMRGLYQRTTWNTLKERFMRQLAIED